MGEGPGMRQTRDVLRGDLPERRVVRIVLIARALVRPGILGPEPADHRGAQTDREGEENDSMYDSHSDCCLLVPGQGHGVTSAPAGVLDE